MPFPAHRIKGARTLWMDAGALTSIGYRDATPERFASDFAYGVCESPTFDKLDFDRDHGQTLTAERYGGFGTGCHAGGARVIDSA